MSDGMDNLLKEVAATIPAGQAEQPDTGGEQENAAGGFSWERDAGEMNHSLDDLPAEAGEQNKPEANEAEKLELSDDDFPTWADAGIEHPSGMDAGDFLTPDDLAKAAGLKSAAEFPAGHPLHGVVDADDFLTVEQVRAAMQYSPDPGQAAVNAYNKWRSGPIVDSQIEQQLDSMSLEGLYELKSICDRQGYPGGVVNQFTLGYAISRAGSEGR